MSTDTAKTRTVYSHGPYHGLPVLPSTAKGLTAVVAGGNGISGQYLTKVLLSHTEVWRTVYSVSRRPAAAGTPGADARVTHAAIDFLAGAERIAEGLAAAGVRDVDYVFYTAYKENSERGLWSGDREMWDENGRMLEDFLVALHRVNGPGRLRRVVLQTGGKHYGMQFGEVRLPATEDQPRVDDGPYRDSPNFYYSWEDILAELAQRHGHDWAVVRPGNIIGAVAGNYMNEAIAVGLYVAVQAELGEAVVFPGTRTKYASLEVQSSALLDAYMEEWAALTPACSNQTFNAANGDFPTWARLWPAVLARFGVDSPSAAAQFSTPPRVPDAWRGARFEMPVPAPVDRVSRSVLETRVSLEKWARDERVTKAWERLRDREGLDQKVWDGASWQFADAIMAMQWSAGLDMGKARRYGFFGTVDSVENWMHVFDEAAEAGLLPKRKA